MKRHFLTAAIYTLVTGLLFGIVYPLAITAIAHVTMKSKAEGQLVTLNGELIGSTLIGQPFTGAGYFHSRPSAAGTGYDAAASSGSNLGPTNSALIQRVASNVKSESAGTPVPVDLVTSSASGLDPDITPAAALYQVPRIAKERQISTATVEKLVQDGTTPRQFGLLGEPRVNVLRLNLALDTQGKGQSTHTP